PGNMILRENSNTVILIDFGLAGNVNSQSINQAANMAFAPWEQMLETERSVTIDVYTLAASLFYLVTGDTPIPSLARKMLNNELIEPKRINSTSLPLFPLLKPGNKPTHSFILCGRFLGSNSKPLTIA
ncbi:MAG: hypothetical protein ACKPGB_21365, partial [Dolichospermum sp.]